MVRTSVFAQLLVAALLVAPSFIFAEVYDQREIKPWFALGGQANFQQTKGINRAVFDSHEQMDNLVLPYYARFDNWTPPTPTLEFGTGVEYGQLLVGFFANVALPQTSVRPIKSAIISWIHENEDETLDTLSALVHYQNARYYMVGLDFSFGWMLAAPESPVNLIPSVRFGFTILNVRWPADYPYVSADGVVNEYRIGESYYSSAGRSITPELELRLRLGDNSRLGVYGGYRFTLIDHINVTATPTQDYFHLSTYNDIDASNFFVGLRYVYVMRSAKEKARDFSKD